MTLSLGGLIDSNSSMQTLSPLIVHFAASLKPSQQQSIRSTQTSHYTLATKRVRGMWMWERKMGGIEMKAARLRLANSSVVIYLEKWVSVSTPRHKQKVTENH